jgi:hypothetical protein
MRVQGNSFFIRQKQLFWFAGFEVLTVVILWDITPWSPVLATYFMMVSCVAYTSTLKMQEICFSEMMVNFHRTTRRYIPEYSWIILRLITFLAPPLPASSQSLHLRICLFVCLCYNISYVTLCPNLYSCQSKILNLSQWLCCQRHEHFGSRDISKVNIELWFGTIRKFVPK